MLVEWDCVPDEDEEFKPPSDVRVCVVFNFDLIELINHGFVTNFESDENYRSVRMSLFSYMKRSPFNPKIMW